MEETIYLYSAIIGCTLVLAQVVLQVFGLFGDAEFGSHEAAGDLDGDAGGAEAGSPEGHGNLFFGILSFKALCAFAGIFGLVGLMLLDGDLTAGTRGAVAVASGIAGMFAVAWLMRGLARLQATGTVDLHNAVGRTGSVYLRVPASGAGVGKVSVEVQGRTVECAAITEGGELPTGARVTVVSVEGDDTLKVAAL